MPAVDWQALGDLRPCSLCACLDPKGCRAALAGRLEGTASHYQPVETLPRRCEGYRPLPQDPDPRPGLERWPGLKHPALGEKP